MPRLPITAVAILAIALSASACQRNRDVPTRLAPSRMTAIGVNAYLWRAAIDTVSFAPLLQADANTGVIITDWYTRPATPGERIKLTVSLTRSPGVAGRVYQSVMMTPVLASAWSKGAKETVSMAARHR